MNTISNSQIQTISTLIEQFKKGGGIHINPKNKGKFTATKKKTGKSTEELTHSKNPLTKKRAIFAQNAKKWKHTEGGSLDKTQQYLDAIKNHSKNPLTANDKKGGKLSKEYIKKARTKPGGSNVGKKKFASGEPRKGPYVGPSGGAPQGSYPIPDLKHAKSALALAHNAPNPEGIKNAVYRKYPQLKKHQAGGIVNTTNYPMGAGTIPYTHSELVKLLGQTAKKYQEPAGAITESPLYKSARANDSTFQRNYGNQYDLGSIISGGTFTSPEQIRSAENYGYIGIGDGKKFAEQYKKLMSSPELLGGYHGKVAGTEAYQKSNQMALTNQQVFDLAKRIKEEGKGKWNWTTSSPMYGDKSYDFNNILSSIDKYRVQLSVNRLMGQ